MKFTIQDKEYQVKWYYETVQFTGYVNQELLALANRLQRQAQTKLSGNLRPRPLDYLKTTKTKCSIFLNNEIVGYGVSTCSPLDRFEKNDGRKRSLTKALNQLFPNPDFKDADYFTLHEVAKNNREIVWWNYFHESPKRKS